MQYLFLRLKHLRNFKFLRRLSRQLFQTELKQMLRDTHLQRKKSRFEAYRNGREKWWNESYNARVYIRKKRVFVSFGTVESHIIMWKGPPRMVCPKYFVAPTLRISGIYKKWYQKFITNNHFSEDWNHQCAESTSRNWLNSTENSEHILCPNQGKNREKQAIMRTMLLIPDTVL